MLETVTKGFRAAKNRLAGKTEISAEMVDESLRDIRVSLLEADVAFDVVKKFVARVREKAIGEVVQTTVTDQAGKKRKVAAGDWFVKICHDELEALMGPVDTSLKLKSRDQVSGIMMVGLQGSGKTTTTGKLANKLLKEGHKPLLVAADIYRPAAVDQLKVLGEKLKVPVFHEPNVAPPELARRGFESARAQKCDVVLIDTAGRLAIDEQLMQELEAIKGQVKPDNILLVCDAMIGQDSVRTAAEFDRRLDLDGVILTKLDGDARGGAALSIKEVTGKPIKFLGMGESMDRLEEFRPDGLAGRILGFGDIVGLMKDFEQVVDQKKAEEDAARLLSGQFSMKDFVGQIRMVRKMGPLKDLLEKFPMFGEMTDSLNPDDKELTKIEAMYDSMTEKERLRPDLIQRSRMERIAKGSGRKLEDVQELLQKFKLMQQVMGTIGQNPGLLGRIPGMRQLGQLSKLKNMDMGQLMGGMGGKDAQMLQQMMAGGGGMGMPMPQMPGFPAGYTPPMGQAAMAKARLMGYAPPNQPGAKAQDKDKLKAKRKRERDARKKSRKR